MFFLTKDEILKLHTTAIERYGGIDGIRDEALLESAVIAPQNRHYYEPEADLAALAGTYAYHINKNHAFIDGNKRTAAAACEAFLNLNNAELAADDDTLINFHLQISDNTLCPEDLESKLRDWIVISLELQARLEGQMVDKLLYEELQSKVQELLALQKTITQSFQEWQERAANINKSLSDAKQTKTGLTLRAEVARITERLTDNLNDCAISCEANLPALKKLVDELIQLSKQFAIKRFLIKEIPSELKILIIVIDICKTFLNETATLFIKAEENLSTVTSSNALEKVAIRLKNILYIFKSDMESIIETFGKITTELQQTIDAGEADLST